jgi:CheY-like chemotaxis protein
MKVLVVEDEDPKRKKVQEALQELFPLAVMKVARSVTSAIHSLRTEKPTLILLDMSLPTFDVKPGEPGGRPQGFGGIEVLRYLDRFGLCVPVVVITAYEAFSREGEQIDLKGLEAQLSNAHPNSFCGIVLFNPLYDRWREELAERINGALRK